MTTRVLANAAASSLVGSIMFDVIFVNFQHVVRYNSFRSYCTSFYGCEISRSSDVHCLAWQRGLRKIWNIPPRSPCLGCVTNYLPLFDDICQCFIIFACICLFHDTCLIRFVALHGILYSTGFSFLGRNVSFCKHRYNKSLFDFFNGAYAGFTRALFSEFTLASLDETK